MKTEKEVRAEIKRLRKAYHKEPGIENACINGGISELQWVLGDWKA
jgi:hypothetical protein